MKDANENGLRSGSAARSPGYRAKQNPARKRDAANVKANYLFARVAVEEAAAAERKPPGKRRS